MDYEQRKKRKDEVSKALYALKKAIRDRNIACYRYSIKITELPDKSLFFDDASVNKFWVHHIESAVERILTGINPNKMYRLRVGYLREKVWKDIINYLSIKYISIGKAVFNFSMDGIEDRDKDLEPGSIAAGVLQGLNSFDYEQIKADETLQRQMAVQVSFAVNNFARSVVNVTEKDSGEDFLLWETEDIAQYRRYKRDGETVTAVLQFFGGASAWNTELFRDSYASADCDYETAFVNDIRKAIYTLRNESFHFTTVNRTKYDWNQKLFGEMFAHDASSGIAVERIRFYSNNLPMFYKAADLRKIMDHLYGTYSPRASQVPSFNSVFVRKNFRTYLVNTLKVAPVFEKLEYEQKWQSGLYYLLKEIYYNSFLQSAHVKKLFYQALDDNYGKTKGYPIENKDKLKEKNAVQDFKKRCEEIKQYSFSEICQIIMTEYNEQNNTSRKVKTAAAQSKNPDIFRHYKMLLMKTLQDAFTLYLNKDIFAFIKSVPTSPIPLIPVEEFLSDWKTGMYASLTERVREDPNLQRWYIMGRFLNGKLLNQMAGTLRSYIQFTGDIRRRAEENHNTLYKVQENKIQYYSEVIEVIDFCIKGASRFSNRFTDYFRDENEYAEYLENYLDFKDKKIAEISYYVAPQNFCNEEGEKANIYMDGENPILQRNIVMAKLFGPDQVLKNIIPRVTKEDIKNYYELQTKIACYKQKGYCSTGEEQEELLRFQRIKNRVEFQTVTDYGELINELLNQLVNWSFLRERDLLYFQIGFHYMCLNNDTEKPELYQSFVTEDGIRISNAILYQIASLYINGLPVYSVSSKKLMKYFDRVADVKMKASGATSAVSTKISVFFNNYAKMMMNDSSNECGENLYNAGLELFENLHEHKNIIDIRNYIDHFKYYSTNSVSGMSLLDLYSEIHDRFFTYDMKYQKNVANMLENILLRHFVILRPEFSTGMKKVSSEENIIHKHRAQINIADKGLRSEIFIYKLSDGQKTTNTIQIPARDNEYLKDIARLLYYPHKAKKDVIDLGEKKENNDRPEGKQSSHNISNSDKENNSKKNNAKSREKKHKESNDSRDTFAYRPFANLKLN